MKSCLDNVTPSNECYNHKYILHIYIRTLQGTYAFTNQMYYVSVYLHILENVVIAPMLEQKFIVAGTFLEGT